MKKVIFVIVTIVSGFATISASPINDNEDAVYSVLNIGDENTLEGAWLFTVKGVAKSYDKGQLIIVKTKEEYVVKLNSDAGSFYADAIKVNNDEISFKIVINNERVFFSLAVDNQKISGTCSSVIGAHAVEGVREVLLQ